MIYQFEIIKRLVCLVLALGIGFPHQTAGDEAVLEKLNQYLRKAFIGQWQYGCVEYIVNEENKYEFVGGKSPAGENVRRWDLRKSRISRAAYEYHLKLKGRKVSEKRQARSDDGKMVFIGNDDAEILPYKAKGLILEPMQYLSRLIGTEVEYQVGGREKIGDFNVVIVSFKTAIPPGERPGTLSGRLWVHPDDGSVWKLSLDPECWSFFESVEIPKEFGEDESEGVPRLRRSLALTADFDVANQGIRYPGRILIQEEYHDGRNVRLETNAWTIRYDDFRFEPSPTSEAIEAAHPILKRAADYCDRLKTVALHYVCDERIIQTNYVYNVVTIIRNSGGDLIPMRKRWNLKKKSNREVLYDYQLLRKEDRLEEKRSALKFDGKRWTKKEDPPVLLPYQARDIVYGPIGFLSSSWQSGFDYFIEGREKTPNGSDLSILASRPNEIRMENAVFGRIWVEPETGAVRRISWDPESIEFFHPEDAPAMFQGLEKQLVWTAYYDIEKNGVYFPSRQEIREEYVGPSGEIILGQVWTVTYENYRFFTVGVDVEIKKAS